MLAGPRDFISRARRKRKMLGGGMRQAGVLAAAGIVALESMVSRLAEDHDKASRLATGLAEVPGVVIDLESVQTNMVYFSVAGECFDPVAFARRLSGEFGVLCYGPAGRIRLVTHRDVPAEHIPIAVDRIADAVTSAR
jgi:threonine aldolase